MEGFALRLVLKERHKRTQKWPIAWLLSVLIVVALVITVAVSVRYETILVVDVISSIFWFVCLYYL